MSTATELTKATCLEVASAASLKFSFDRGDESFFCPWHDDARASFRIAKTKDVWKCDPCNRRRNRLPIETLIVCRKTTKTDAGERLIPLNRDAVWALGQMWDRAKKETERDDAKHKEVLPEHYVFYACENHTYDPTRSMSPRSAWRSLTKAAGLKGLRFHDLRHSAITSLAEAAHAIAAIQAIAGHVSRKMLEHYSHIRLQAKRTAVEALETRPPAQAEQQPQQTAVN